MYIFMVFATGNKKKQSKLFPLSPHINNDKKYNVNRQMDGNIDHNTVIII